MFHQLIQITDLRDEKSDLFFRDTIQNNINCPPRDAVPVSVLRAIIHPFMEPGEHLTVGEIYFDHYTQDVPWVLENDVCFVEHNDSSCPKEELDRIQERYEAIGYVERPKVRIYNEKLIDFRCLVNEETRSAIFLSPKMNNQTYHRVISSILHGLPWYMKRRKEAKFTDLETELLKSVADRDHSRFMHAVIKVAETYDFETAWIEKQLDGFEGRIFDRQIRNLENELDNIRRDIENRTAALNTAYRNLQESETRLLGYRYGAEQIETGGLLDYFKRNKNVQLSRIEDDRIWFFVKTVMNGFDPDAAERAIRGSNGHNGVAQYYYDGIRSDDSKISADAMQEVLTAIFIDQTMFVRTCAEYMISAYPQMEGISGADYPPNVLMFRMPNPHIDRYSCTGGNSAPARDYLRKGNYVMAIEQCIYSASQLNFGDSTVFSSFMRSMYRNEYRCIELPDGTFGNAEEAWKWIEANKTKEE